MTIEPRIETARSAKEGGFRFVRSSTVAVVSVTAQRASPTTPLRIVLEACVARFAVLLRGWLRSIPQGRIFLFVATPLRDQHNAVRRHRGVWAEDLSWLADGALRSPSVEISDAEGLRFAGLAEIGEHDLFEAAEFVRTHHESFLFVSACRDLTEESARSLVEKVFPNGQAAMDWARVVDQVEEDEDVCIRVSGNFDDREASIDAFLSADLLRSLEGAAE